MERNRDDRRRKRDAARGAVVACEAMQVHVSTRVEVGKERMARYRAALRRFVRAHPAADVGRMEGDGCSAL